MFQLDTLKHKKQPSVMTLDMKKDVPIYTSKLLQIKTTKEAW